MMGVSIAVAGLLAGVAMWLAVGYVLPGATLGVRLGAGMFWSP